MNCDGVFDEGHQCMLAAKSLHQSSNHLLHCTLMVFKEWHQYTMVVKSHFSQSTQMGQPRRDCTCIDDVTALVTSQIDGKDRLQVEF
jgi:UV DNA damage repair endonuclease